jgi:probable lipoprotein NlpC
VNILIDVNKYIGVPYKDQGRSITEGLDCIGLAVCIFEELGVSLPSGDGLAIDRNWFRKDRDRFLRALQEIGEPIDISEVKRYDIVYFVIVGNIVSHMGVMLDNETFIHSIQKRDCFISKLDRYWRKKIRGARRIPEIASLQTD